LKHCVERGKGICVSNEFKHKIRAAEKAGGKRHQGGEMDATRSCGGSAAELRRKPRLSACSEALQGYV